MASFPFKPGFVTLRGAQALREMGEQTDRTEPLATVPSVGMYQYERINVKLTAVDSSTPQMYSGTEQFFDEDGQYVDMPNGRLFSPTNMPIYERNDFTVSSFPFYAEIKRRVCVDGIAVYEFDVGEGAGTANPLTVEEVDAAPSVANVETLRFDQDDGFVVSTPGAGIARVDFVLPDSSRLTVREVDAAPSVNPVNILEFDQADGFVVSSPGAGIARIDFTGGGGTPTLAYDIDYLATSFSITAGEDTWEDSGVAVVLPAAGTYRLQANVWGSITPDGNNAYILARFATSGADVAADSKFEVVEAKDVAGQDENLEDAATSVVYLTVVGTTTINLEVKWVKSVGGNAPFAVLIFGQDLVGQTALEYLRVA